MSDGETFLDDILEGVIVVEAQQSLPGEHEVDTSRKTQPKPNSKRSPRRSPEPEPIGGSLPDGVTKSDPPESTRTSKPSRSSSPELFEVAPRDILRTSEQNSAPEDHFDPADEINAINEASIDSPVREGSGQKIRWDQSSSFASIAREIAASVDPDVSAHKLNQKRVHHSEEEEPSHVFFGKKGRRAGHVNRVTVIEVVGLLLVLVLGLAAEYKYVGRNQTPDSIATTAAQSEAGLPVVKLPQVAPIKSAGTLFEFASSASAQSAAFAVTSSFTTTWSVDCSTLYKPSTIGFILQAGSQKATGAGVEMSVPGTKIGTGSTLGPGSYVLTVHAPGTCSWTMRGLPTR